VIESMASGKPLIATTAGGTPEAVVDGETGLLVPSADTQRLAESIMVLLDDPAKAEQMGRAARQRAVSHFDIRELVRKTEEYYSSILDVAT
jgi:glycosyltransferase involved in cell wall biosynthesis